MSATSPSRILLALSLFANAVYASLPLVDFDRMGTVGLAGAFAGLDLFQNASSSVHFDPTTATILLRDIDGALTRLASTNAGGRIAAGCSLKDAFYVAGSFSSIAGTPANNVAFYTPSSGAFAAVGSDGPNGEVDAIFCDTKENKVWVGGSFTSPGSNVAVWDPKAGTWSPPPFVGFSGAQSKVLSITTNASDSSIFFAGSFITSFEGDGSSVSNGTNNPNVPFSAGATPFSSSLVPIPLQDAQVDGSPSSSDPQFSNIKNVLCPSGGDGPGNSWFAADSNTAVVTVRAFSFISANGLRLGNTFQPNHGTTGFSVTTIPDNKVQTLHYRDPITGQTQTCSDPCPLSTDSSLLYQDFLFENTLTITGVQLKLSEFVGTAPGLHILQLLSSGAFASSVDSNNAASCFAPNPSNSTRTGDWVAKVANTDIAGTIQTVLVSSVNVGTSVADGPTFTWIPYVSASGNYDINLLVPGCTNLQDCAARTTVKITVFPGEGLQPWVSTISQQNTADATILIYSGPILSSSPKFVTTISMTLADNPAGPGQGGKYELVADRVQMVLKSVNGSTADASSDSGSGDQRTINGFGFFEWPRSLGASVDASKVLPNSTLTSTDSAGIDLFNGAGGSNGLSFANPSAVATVVHHPSGSVFLGGNFTLSSGAASGSANLVAFKNGALARLTDNGLNGPVSSLVLSGDQLFVGGGFSDTLSGSTGGRLRGIAIYNVQKGAWSSLGFGVNGRVTSLGLDNGQVLVAGNFTRPLDSAKSDAGVAAAGFATWDLKKSAWVNSGGFVVGSMTFIGNATTSSTQFVAGNIEASQKFGASGMVILKNGDRKSGPKVAPLGAPLGVAAGALSSSKRRRSAIPAASAWISHVRRSKLFSRQAPSTQLSPLPPPLSAPAPAVLVGTFWTNTTSSAEAAVIGGNFSFYSAGSSSASQGVAIYDPASATIRGLQGSQLNGTVRALLVDGGQLYVGGEFSIQGANANGLAVYDLSKDQWNVNEIPALQANAGSSVVVRSITKSASKPNTIIVAGSFSQAGSLRCQSICAYDTSSKQWNALGNGIQGEVASISYAGGNQEFLVASGSIALSDNTVNVVQFGFANSTWTPLGTPGELPGPVSALEVNNGNASSIFAAGRSSDGSSSFLSFWNGVHWSTIGSTFQGGTTVAQLTMVPLQDTHSAKGVIEPDRMLMVSGQLDDSSFGNASSALFDGQTFIPYIVSSSLTGSSGAVAALFRSFSSFSFNHRRFLATGVVILISIAIAAGVVFLLALIGILWTLLTRRDDKLGKFDGAEDEDDDSTHHRPSSLLEHINAATRTTILGASPFNNASGEKEEEKITRDNQDPFGPDASNYLRAETPSDAVGGILAEETSRPAHARYSFDGAGEGELPMSAGAEIEVLDDRDAA
ncbi:putative cortical protein marker for cell polarity [Lyophyllum shimeji]|uniref:Cortical protein marker for cell polarity n=1 Tax=Lyophyllum shimeji TaxID=47721 RepID=A0A9P3PJS8_LYOSH|nr:putative cortical protein marker for cell polarity [Lyophyllum shimeji]